MPPRHTVRHHALRAVCGSARRAARHALATAGAVALVGLAATGAGAQTRVTLDFNALGATMDPANGINYVANCYVERGVRISSPGLPCGESPAATFGMYMPTEPLGYTGSPALFNSLGASVDLMPAFGGPFALYSLDLAPLLLGPLSLPVDVVFTGFRIGGGTVTQTVTVPVVGLGGRPVNVALTGFTNLASARFTPGGPDFAVQFDNVQAGVVPEPGTVTLVALGLLGVAGAARRRRRAR